VLLAS